MKTTGTSELSITDPDTVSDALEPEYRFDYSKAKPNRFALRDPAARTVRLDADVAAVFTTEEEVNTILRALIEAMPQASRHETP
jgi:hypothetical protein